MHLLECMHLWYTTGVKQQIIKAMYTGIVVGDKKKQNKNHLALLRVFVTKHSYIATHVNS